MGLEPIPHTIPMYVSNLMLWQNSSRRIKQRQETTPHLHYRHLQLSFKLFADGYTITSAHQAGHVRIQ